MVKAGSVVRKPDGGWQIDREWYGQGYIFKDEEAFLTTPDAPCYVAELSDEVYNHLDILRICNGQEEIAKLCFDEIDWQHPETWLDEAIREDEFEMCPKCKKLYPMYGERCACPVCGTDPDDDPEDGLPGSFDINTMRTGKILEWYPQHVRVCVYNDQTGQKEDILLSKSAVAIIENPLYAVMNEPNSTMQRLIRKLNLLDVVDEQSSSGKLDLIIQLPYVIKTEARRQQAEKRRVEIERQLAGSKYGIAYTDGTERITQLNRSVENNLMKQIEYLTSMLYSQLGITQSILDGSADEKTMLNYYNRTIEPIISAIVDEMKRKFLTKTARSQKQSILFFRDPFKLVPVADLSEIADKFTRNEIMTSNEIRQIIGMKPSDDPKADELKNSNISEAKSEPSNEGSDVESGESDSGADYDSIVNELLDGLEKEIDEIIGNYVSDDEEES